MSKSILSKLFGLGAVPRASRTALENESIVLIEEGLRGSATYRRFRGPGKRFLLRRVWFAGALVLTKTRLAGFAFGRPILNIAFDDPGFLKLTVDAESDSVVRIFFDAEAFADDSAGRVEYRFHCGSALRFAQLCRASAKQSQFVS